MLKPIDLINLAIESSSVEIAVYKVPFGANCPWLSVAAPRSTLPSVFFQNVDNWNFDTFSLNNVCKSAPLRYIGYELLTRHGCLHKYKVSLTVLYPCTFSGD